MSESPSSPPANVKIYDRPERKGVPPLLLALIVVILAVVGFFSYRAYAGAHSTAATPAGTRTGSYRPLIVPYPDASPQRVATAAGAKGYICLIHING